VELVALTRGECLQLLGSHHFGRLAVNPEDGPPIIRPLRYLFDVASQSVVFAAVPGSRFYALIRSAPATFEIDGVEESSQREWSVILRGTVADVGGQIEIRHLDRLSGAVWGGPASQQWMRIRARTISGVRRPAPDPVPGGYLG
jgi:nitroimidazol reductase NimA-like FMN-containing flavoprotein (pyridoxamine 5'-phosphate oxidase superfamily)